MNLLVEEVSLAADEKYRAEVNLVACLTASFPLITLLFRDVLNLKVARKLVRGEDSMVELVDCKEKKQIVRMCTSASMKHTPRARRPTWREWHSVRLLKQYDNLIRAENNTP